MQGNASVDHQTLTASLHRVIHRVVKQPEDDRLIANHRLIVTLDVVNRPLLSPMRSKLVKQLAHIPLFVLLVFEHLDP